MNKKPSVYFPSLYDFGGSSANEFNIWKKLFLAPKSYQSPVSEEAPWPPGLAEIRYEPLKIFSPSSRVDSLAWSELDEICELDIRLKEIELLTLTGDGFDSRRYTFLKTLKDEKMQDIKAAQEQRKQTSKTCTV
ncbi:uncharacterized protein C11orf91 [Latimeria chalumnae]|uniref:Chromosome 11 open reading frame 91 n=1 Tax=Latimeria chalumnae TaxID=7897 RepID=M3XIM3_LATCH|nr:PREDICTED: uncharacterized protein C11orf91 homolog [Latimeria chalumnae]|eukprot:XP_005991309.1 PREDICTED: uncharacterized protein C11orf91 homolog [Latimeria chalumnae]